MMTLTQSEIRPAVDQAISASTVWDFHTHLFPPAFGFTPDDPNGLMLWGIDDLLTYHYLIAEVLREGQPQGLTPEKFFALGKSEQADLIWQLLFVASTPLSEACRGVLTTLQRLGLDPNEQTLDQYRTWFSEQTPEDHIDRVFDLAGVEQVTMTNDLFDDNETARWLKNPSIANDSRFAPVLRFDQLVVDWPFAAAKLRQWGFSVESEPTDETIDSVRQCLREWIERMKPLYCAMSLPPDWRYPVDGSSASRILAEAIIPECIDNGLPLALMIGVTRQINPAIRMAGDTVGEADVRSVARLCSEFPQLRLLVTMLSRENQYELVVTARKFANLTPFGCWWFLNTPGLIEEITKMRLELLGPTFIPQHSDCRILEQLIYKWDHSRKAIAGPLSEQYEHLVATGRQLTTQQIERDVDRLFRGNIKSLLKL